MGMIELILLLIFGYFLFGFPGALVLVLLGALLFLGVSM
jgi:hypothetical protein